MGSHLLLNKMSSDMATIECMKCCTSMQWAKQMSSRMPFKSLEEMEYWAETIWFNLTENEWLKAFSGHPKIGDFDALRTEFATGSASEEQKGAVEADETILKKLAKANELYEKKHGFIFIVCATGKSAEEMLLLLEERLLNSTRIEIRQAAIEQAKIFIIRIRKLFCDTTQPSPIIDSSSSSASTSSSSASTSSSSASTSSSSASTSTSNNIWSSSISMSDTNGDGFSSTIKRKDSTFTSPLEAEM